MRIINNKIYIGIGETPTYSAKIVYSDGSPYRISNEVTDIVGQFVVQRSAYNKERVINHYLDMSSVHKFNDTGLATYYNPGQTTNEWLDSVQPETADADKLHVRTFNGLKYYAYYDWENNHWIEYDFTVSTPLLYQETSVLENKTYLYEIALFGGEGFNEDGSIKNIGYKTTLLPLSEFIVEARISD